MILNKWAYQGVNPEIAEDCDLDPSSWVIGNVKIGKGVVLKSRAVLRGDGQNIKIGRGVVFLDGDDVYEEGLCFLYESKADAIKFFSTAGDKSDAGQ